ncbi:hypothetical protein AV530_006896 [Patagioenas fasciata monilis]|uniref:Uncharacterized protein n=1 Tax=Patagioenas fasciata monilis TaxID=372326 RepID=A0A1V4JZQ9_PATFA|nr:hypothetical protein AV530_006896 [Patagioenas fasciata monilis]
METPTAPGGKGRPGRGQRSAGKRRNTAGEPGRSGPGSPAGGGGTEREATGQRPEEWVYRRPPAPKLQRLHRCCSLQSVPSSCVTETTNGGVGGAGLMCVMLLGVEPS